MFFFPEVKDLRKAKFSPMVSPLKRDEKGTFHRETMGFDVQLDQFPEYDFDYQRQKTWISIGGSLASPKLDFASGQFTMQVLPPST